MKTNKLFKTALLLLLAVAGTNTAWADEVTLAQWDFSESVKYTGATSENKTYYTASIESYATMEYTFAANQPFFYPTSGSLTGSTLTINSTDTGKKWYISSFNSGALRMYTSAPTEITNPTLPAQHYNYAEVNFSATGYKNVQFSFKMSGNNGNTLPVYVLVSTDGGTTWYLDAGSYTTGSSWNNLKETTSSLGVDNCANVKVRALIGYHSGATSDMYLNNFKVTGENIGGATTHTLNATSCNTAYGYVSMNLPGTSFVDGTSITLTATKLGSNIFTKWNTVGDVQVSTDNPYTFSINSNTTLSAIFVPAIYYTLSTAVNIPWAGTITSSAGEGDLLSGTVVTLTAATNEGYTFTNWSTGETTTSINVTMDANKAITANYTKNTEDYGTTNVRVASWTFDGNYDTSAGDGVTIYTPTGVGHANVSSTYTSQKPCVRPDYYYGANISDYSLKIKCDDGSQTWKLENFNNSGRYIMSFDNGAFTTVDDYTVVDQQKYYYEASFPTTGFKDLSVALSISAHSEPGGMTYGVVYSLDGTTWSSLGTITTQISGGKSHWNYWDSTPNSINLPAQAENQDKVIIRFIRQRNSSGESGVDGQNNKLDYITIKGTIANQTTLDESVNYTPVAKTADVTLTRSITKGNWSTLCLPFDISATDLGTALGTTVTLAQFSSYDSGTNALTFTAESGDQTVTANQPCMIKVSSDVSGAVINGVTIVSGDNYVTKNGMTFQGVYNSINMAFGDFFVSGNKLYTATASTKPIKPFRGYFTTSAGTAKAPMLNIIEEGGNTTAIYAINADGTLEPIADGKVYNLNGQRVAQPAKGLYIVNGKKVIVK